MAPWNPQDHPRWRRGDPGVPPNVPGRFRPKETFSGRAVRDIVADPHSADDDDLLDAFAALSGRARLDAKSRAQLAELDRELARREGKTSLVEVTDDTPQERQVDALVARGYPYAEAYAEVYGGKAGPDERAAEIERRPGETREQAVRRLYAEATYLQMLEAETWTRGHMLSKAGQAARIDVAGLFSGPRARARKWASEELKRYWAEKSPRRTYAEFRAALVGDSRARGRARASALAGSGRDFGL